MSNDFCSRWQRVVGSRPTGKAHLFKFDPFIVAENRMVSLCGVNVVLSPLELEEVDAAWPHCPVCNKREQSSE